MSDAIQVRMACGCVVDVSLGSEDPPRCGPHREFRVTFIKTRAPRFVGTAKGPHVETVELEPFKGTFNA